MASHSSAAATAIERFLASARDPVLVEPGEPPIPLQAGTYSLDNSSGRLLLEAWDDRRNLARTITALRSVTPARLELEVRRFGNRSGSILLLDQARASNHSLHRRAARQVFREQFRLMLARNFPGWKITGLTSDPDLHHSLSPTHARALLRKGTTAWAAIGAPDDLYAASAALSFGLIWLDYLRRRERRLLVQGLALFLPSGRELATCLRLRSLNPLAAQFAVFLYGQDNWEQQVDPTLHGNLETTLLQAPAHTSPPRITPLPPEAELEQLLRRRLSDIDGLLLPGPIYGQVPAVAGLDRGIIDLLAADYTGRLTVLELKATADLHMPLQALDYWMRVHWHNQHGDFSSYGYFPELAIHTSPPRLLLIAPALEFHPTTETILRYLSPDIEVERIGLAADWRTQIRVVFRLHGAQSPY